MQFWKKWQSENHYKRYLFALLLILFGAIWYAWPTDDAPVEPKEATIQHLSWDFSNHQLNLYTRVNFQLPTVLQEAVLRGVSLPFVYEVDIQAVHPYWFNQTVLTAQQLFWVQYNALLRQWTLQHNSRSIIEWSLEEALRSLSRIDWQSIPFYPDGQHTYRVRLRFFLDKNRLPRAFRFDAFNNPNWDLSTPWKQIVISPTK